MTTTIGGSGTEPFTAEIDLVDVETGSYEGSLSVGAEVYRAWGGYNPYISEDYFALRVDLADMEAALSPGPPFYGTEWSGAMIGGSWEGEWYFRGEDGKGEEGGTFSLERLP